MKGGIYYGITERLWWKAGRAIGSGTYRINYGGPEMVSHPGGTDM